MEFGSPFLKSAGIKAERGFTGEAYSARAETFVVGIASELAVTIKGGQETAVMVDVPKLYPNANVSSIKATLTVVSGASTSPTATKIGVTEGKDPARTIKVSIDPVDGIQNAQIRLNNGTVFWTHPGQLPAGDYDIPDFSKQANAYLDKYRAQQDSKVTLQFMVKSDTDGSVRIKINGDVRSTLLQTQSWKNELDSTFRVDRTLKLTFNQIERLPIDTVTPPSGGTAKVSEIHLDAGGQFSSDRLLGEIETHEGGQFATVSQEFSLGQQATAFARAGEPNSRFKDLLKSTIQCTGVAGYFEADDKAEIYVEMQADQSDAPAGGAPLAKSNVAFIPADKNNPQPWTFAKFEKPAELKPDVPYWIVVKIVRGSIRLGLKVANDESVTQPPVTRGALKLNRGGLVWKSYANTPLWALLSLVYVPQPDNQTAAIQISMGEGGSAELIDPQNTAKTISFPASGTGAPLLVVGSRALGSLTIANVIQEYRAV